MKVWLNDLKEGDIFWKFFNSLGVICECQHMGDAHNYFFKMSRIKYKVINTLYSNKKLDDALLKSTFEDFVNQYVVTTKEEAVLEACGALQEDIKLQKAKLIAIEQEKRDVETSLDKDQEYLNKIKEGIKE